MKVISQIDPLLAQLNRWRSEKKTLAVVPTMGNLHAGHFSLMDKARQIADLTLVTIFVNPIQFVAGEDFEQYPRTLKNDLGELENFGIDLVFTPDTHELFPTGLEQQTRITVPGLDDIYCGATRPGHFSGVATIVSKLFNIIQPDFAVFGEKDFQQLLLIKKLVRDLNFRVEIIGMPTTREPDGLAMSSRNQYLNSEERRKAPFLYQLLKETAEKIISGDTNYEVLMKSARFELEKHGFQPDYFAICDAHDLGPPASPDLVIITAVRLGQARLIDNITLRYTVRR